MARQAHQANARQQKRLYIEQRSAEATRLNRLLEAEVKGLHEILEVGVLQNPAVDLQRMVAGKDDSISARLSEFPATSPAPPLQNFLPAPLSLWGRLFGKRKQYLLAVEEANRKHEEAVQNQQKKAIERAERLQKIWEGYVSGEDEGVRGYFKIVLEMSPYPLAFAPRFRLAYVPTSRQIVVEYDIPNLGAVPEQGGYKYVQKTDEIVETAKRKLADRRALYARVVASVTLRTQHELFAGDTQKKVDVVVFNGFVSDTDKSTGRFVRACVISLRSTRDEFEKLDLLQVDPIACVKHLQAHVSRSPDELVPVRPVVEFDMVDPRFIQHGNVLSTLDSRPNLLEMTPSEFETLVTNLFEGMGLETKLTQPSRDGGVDCVAYDPRPILGGKVVVQAKRYTRTVGVSAVRDLYGTMQNENASKGILVTTSDFGKASFDFAIGKPIELINGSNLLYLLREQGVEAKIEIPEDWVDPLPE